MRKRLVCLVMALTMLICFTSVPASAEDVEEPDVHCKAALLVDTKTDQVLFEKKSHKKMSPASLTKMMTCLLVMENLDLDKKVKIPAEATGYIGSAIGLKKGEVFTVEQLLNALMIYSANDCAVALGIEVAGSHLKFVEMMNARAEELGLENTFFLNANGFTNDMDHHTTANDLYVIAKKIMKYPEVREITSRKTFTMPETTESGPRKLDTTNGLLKKKMHYEGVYGVKTGFMGASGYCFVGACEKNGMDLICVVLNDETRKESFQDATKLFDYGFDNFYTEKMVDKGEDTGHVMVKYGHDTFVPTETKEAGYITLPNQAAESMADSDVKYDKGIEAPIKKGTKVGVVEMKQDGKVVSTTDVVITKDVKKGGPWSALYISDMMFYAGVVIIAAVIAFIASVNIRRKKRKAAAEARAARRQAAHEAILQAEKEDKIRRDWPF
ncbi:MAG: D-alanyl-D-alanine carboxypeptidase [Firmicutes bacterium]|nr:D-alanyl-D-alanine carboxypeptidase [Bacillota bacterium]